MGLHAAHVVMFSALLFLRSRSQRISAGPNSDLGDRVHAPVGATQDGWDSDRVPGDVHRSGVVARHAAHRQAGRTGTTCVLVVAGLFMFVSSDGIIAPSTRNTPGRS